MPVTKLEREKLRAVLDVLRETPALLSPLDALLRLHPQIQFRRDEDSVLVSIPSMHVKDEAPHESEGRDAASALVSYMRTAFAVRR